MQPSKVGNLLDSDAGLGPVVARAREISALAELCYGFLPTPLSRLVSAISLSGRPAGRQLVMLAATPAAAAKLKLLAEALRLYLSEQGSQVNSVSVRVQPRLLAAPPGGRRPPRQLSPASLERLHELYQKMPDSSARAALKNLLDHHLRK